MSDLEFLRTRRAELVAANERAEGWGGATAARGEEIAEIDRAIARLQDPAYVAAFRSGDHEDLVPKRGTHRANWRKLWLLSAAVIGGSLAVAALTIIAARAEVVDGRRIVIIDGDTVALPGGERIRLQAIDAPESFRPACEAELVAGLKAKARLAELARVPRLTIERCDIHGDRCQDTYGRTLANLRTRAGDIGATLIREGHALRYVAGEKAGRDAHWCPPA